MAQTNKSKFSKEALGPSPMVSILTLFILLVAFFIGKKKLVFGENAENKPFNSFQEFYPYYITQHADETCRRLHFIGTTLVVLYALYVPSVAPSLMISGVSAYIVFALTKSISNGLLEMLVMTFIFVFYVKQYTGSWKKGLIVPIVAYSFAWVGHFYFEMNRPATFIYPLFSLMSDFRLWFEIATLQRPF